MDTVSIFLQVGRGTEENSKAEKSMVKAPIIIKMAVFIKEYGLLIRKTVKDAIHILTMVSYIYHLIIRKIHW